VTIPQQNVKVNFANQCVRHRRTHETQPDGQPMSAPPTGGSFSEEDLENEENEFGSLVMDETSSPEEMNHQHHQHRPLTTTTMVSMQPLLAHVPAPSSLIMPSHMQAGQMLAPSQLIQPSMLGHM
jgi:hypothetical protein